MVSISDL